MVCRLYRRGPALQLQPQRSIRYVPLLFLSFSSFHTYKTPRSNQPTFILSTNQPHPTHLFPVRFVVVEIATPGQEATLYELLSTVQASSFTIGLFLASSITEPFGANVCSVQPCPYNVVDTANFEETGGPSRFTNYTLCIVALSMLGTAVFSRFLPRSRAECREWKDKEDAEEEEEEEAKDKSAHAPRTCVNPRCARGWAGVGLTVGSAVLGVVLVVCVLLPAWSCSPWLGGAGCSAVGI